MSGLSLNLIEEADHVRLCDCSITVEEQDKWRSAVQGARDAKIIPAGIAEICLATDELVRGLVRCQEPFAMPPTIHCRLQKAPGLRVSQRRSEAMQRSVCSSSRQFTMITLRSATIVHPGAAVR